MKQYGKRHQKNRNHHQGESRNECVRVIEGKLLDWRRGAQKPGSDGHDEVHLPYWERAQSEFVRALGTENWNRLMELSVQAAGI
jgi:hypothetical protein